MITQQMIIGSSFYSGPITPPWPPGSDPGGSVSEITGNAQLGFMYKHYPFYFADDVASVLTATPDLTSADTSFSFSGLDQADNFSLMWTGYLQAPSTGQWKFRTTSDDASYFWIGSDAVSGSTTANANVSNGGLHGSTTVESVNSVALTGGLYYPIRAIFGEYGGGETFFMEWNQDNTSWNNFNMAYARYNAASTDGF